MNRKSLQVLGALGALTFGCGDDDASLDAGRDAEVFADGGLDAGSDGGLDGGGSDGGLDGGLDGASDGRVDGGSDASVDGGFDPCATEVFPDGVFARAGEELWLVTTATARTRTRVPTDAAPELARVARACDGFFVTTGVVTDATLRVDWRRDGASLETCARVLASVDETIEPPSEAGETCLAGTWTRYTGVTP